MLAVAILTVAESVTQAKFMTKVMIWFRKRKLQSFFLPEMEPPAHEMANMEMYVRNCKTSHWFVICQMEKNLPNKLFYRVLLNITR